MYSNTADRSVALVCHVVPSSSLVCRVEMKAFFRVVVCVTDGAIRDLPSLALRLCLAARIAPLPSNCGKNLQQRAKLH